MKIVRWYVVFTVTKDAMALVVERFVYHLEGILWRHGIFSGGEISGIAVGELQDAVTAEYIELFLQKG